MIYPKLALTINNENDYNVKKTKTIKTLLMLSVVTMMMLIPGGIILPVHAALGDQLLTINNPTPEYYDYFGYSVATTPTGDILVGAYLDDTGTVYLFDGNDGSLLLTINNPAPAVGDGFGKSVATTPTGDLLISARYDDTGAPEAGTVYLFDGNDGSLLLTINNPEPAAYDRFGVSVATTPTGDLLIGASYDDTGVSNAGTVYLINGTDGSLLLTINNPTPATSDYFGYSVATTNTGNLLVGAFLDNTGAGDTGSVYLFDGTDGSLLLTINNPTPEGGEYFGYSVATTSAGDILVGASRDVVDASYAGSVYLFDGTNGNLLLTINNPEPADFDYFGYSVATTSAGDLLVGAKGEEEFPPFEDGSAGSAYLFDGTDGSLLLTINNPTPEAGDNFGRSVATTSAGDLLIGTLVNNTKIGSAYLFEGISASIPAPIITSLIADDPDNLDNVYSINDTLTIIFDSDTNTPGGMGIQNKTAVNNLYNFTDSLGESYTGVWNSTVTFVITISNTTGAAPPIIGTTTVTPTGITPILSFDETSGPSDTTSPALSGDFGLYAPPELFCGQIESYYNIINGTESQDFLVGTNNPDLMFGNGGNDMIKTRGDNNCIYAGDGNDFVLAANNNTNSNTVYGGAGDDSIQLMGIGIAYGEDGEDSIYIIKPSAGHLLDGGDGSDLCVTIAPTPINTSNCEITVP